MSFFVRVDALVCRLLRLSAHGGVSLASLGIFSNYSLNLKFKFYNSAGQELITHFVN